MARGRNRRERIAEAFDEFCDAVGRALGAADGALAAAAQAHAEAMVEMWMRNDGLDAALADPELRGLFDNPRLARPVERMLADRAAAIAPWLETGPPRLAEILVDAAPGSAGRDPAEWIGRVGRADGGGPVPSLWTIGTGRIGTGGPGFPVAVPLLDESHLQITSTHDSRTRAEAMLESLLMRVMSYFRPGVVALHVWDVGQFTGSLPGLYPLTRTGLLTVHDPGRLPQLLEELSDRIRRVHTRVLVDGHLSLRALAEADGVRTEPWVVAVLVGNRSALREDDHRQLQRVARGGLACGVQLVLLDVPMTVDAPMETVRLDDEGLASTSMTGRYVTVEPEPRLASGAVTAACHAIADEHENWRNRIGSFADLLPPPDNRGQAHSAAGLRAPVGFTDGRPVDMVLADASPHALIGGPSGSGKTNLMLTMISSMAARYGPDELEFYLLDFKEGVSFAQFAPGRRDQTWLPHARLVGVNINTDREFGLALLQFLADEMRRRAEAAKSHEVTKLEELRAADPDGRWPRIVAVIDEFQYLFAERDAVTRAATILLEDVARRGRSQGIHLVLASQDVSGIEAFWGRAAIFEQFVLRIALPRARRVLAELNDATLGLPRWHAVLNHESGIRHGNEIVRIPDATGRGAPGAAPVADSGVHAVQRELYERHAHEGRAEPRLFDGSRAPRFADLVGELTGSTTPARSAGEAAPRALVGQSIDVAGSAASVPLPAAPGRNLGVLASVGRDAVQVLGAAAGSLAGQFGPGEVDVLIAPLLAETTEPAARLSELFRASGHVTETVALDGVRARVDALAAEVTERLGGAASRRPVLLVLYAADAADTKLEREGTESMRKLLRFGPETGVHVLGWWRSVQRLRALLMMSASIDDLGAWVALDVQGSELQALAPGMAISWSPRPGRGLFFDRAQHAAPEVVIVPSLEEP
ncbi:FtsK/SpoIIIE domain-containing protein [Pseudonocardia xinjiangensis]|uniref:Cell division protein FtsK n=1 Tax=Pseudonocardia xinjiangensis TaxID=75289 RepID=A0ABX1REB3_9PSEU|nr:FtsK/SpoIIIE domain-containing protein [Pseudonocardia xinjiangensis]NMH78733.1 cell division protein FtsK [Pseudonocardia xinjiangensis]